MTRMSKWFAVGAACCLGAVSLTPTISAQDPPPAPPASVLETTQPVVEGTPIDGLPIEGTVDAGAELGEPVELGTSEPGILTETPSAPIEGEIVGEGEYVEGAVPGEVAIGGEPCGQPAGRPDLFYNYYVAPRCHQGNAAGMYTAPKQVPGWVGHTYYTYQPFYPHEFLYPHYREYYNVHSLGYGGYGVTSYTKTEMTAYRGNLRTTFAPALIRSWYTDRKYRHNGF